MRSLKTRDVGLTETMAFGSTTSTAFHTPRCAKRMKSTDLESSPLRNSVANPDTGVIESEADKRGEEQAVTDSFERLRLRPAGQLERWNISTC